MVRDDKSQQVWRDTWHPILIAAKLRMTWTQFDNYLIKNFNGDDYSPLSMPVIIFRNRKDAEAARDWIEAGLLLGKIAGYDEVEIEYFTKMK